MRIVPSTRLVVAVCLERQWLREAIVFPLVPRFEVDSGCLCTALMLCWERATAEFPWISGPCYSSVLGVLSVALLFRYIDKFGGVNRSSKVVVRLAWLIVQ